MKMFMVASIKRTSWTDDTCDE